MRHRQQMYKQMYKKPFVLEDMSGRNIQAQKQIQRGLD